MAQPKVNADLPIQALLQEKRKFPPPKAFVKNALGPASCTTQREIVTRADHYLDDEGHTKQTARSRAI